MRCSYQGEFTVTGGKIEEIEKAAKDKLESIAFVWSNEENESEIQIEFGSTGAVGEGDVLAFLAKAEENGWTVNGEIPYYGDYEGKLIVTDNMTEALSTEDLAVREYRESPAVKKEKTTAENAVSMASYLFLRLAYGKEEYPETVVENMEWLVSELLEDTPSDLLVQALNHELQEGFYEGSNAFIFANLNKYYNLSDQECEKIICKLGQ